MESSIKINSISIDLANTADSGKCQHFSIRGFVAEMRERDRRKCWPFSADTVELLDHESYSLPSLTVVKSRWWRCPGCIKDINAKEINDNDFHLHSHSKSAKEKNLDTVSSGKRKKEKKNDVERYQNVDHTAAFLKKVRSRAKDASSIKSKSSKLATQEKVKKKSKESREVVNGGEAMEGMTAFGSSEIAGVVDDTPDKLTKKNHRNSHVSMEQEECDNVSSDSRQVLGHNPENMTGLPRRKTRKVRLLSDLLSNKNNETLSKRESVKGKKRKSCGDEDCRSPEITNYASRILSKTSKSCDSEDKTVSGAESRPSGESQSTDSGFDKDPIKGKQRNKRFQVVDERFTEKDAYDYASPVNRELVLHTERMRTEKELGLAKKRRKVTTDNKKSTMITFNNNIMPDTFPQACQRNTMPQSTRDFLNSNWLDRSFDKLSASDGNLNKQRDDNRPAFPLPLQEKMHYKNGDRVMLRGVGTTYFRYFGSTYKSANADGCLRTGVNVDFSHKRSTGARPSFLNTEVAGSSCALQKDVSVAQGKGKEVVVQELSKAPRFQSSMTSEQIDDIPMEIVELLAKNQYERCLPDREEDQHPSPATSSLSKNALLIDLNETYDNSMDNTLRQPKPCGQAARNGDDGYFVTGKQNSLDYFPASQFGQPYVPSGFGVPNQSSSIQFSGVVRPSQQSSHNSQWVGNVPTTMTNQQSPSPSPLRVLRPCNTCQSVQQPQHRDDTLPVWPSPLASSHPQKSVSLSMQNFMDQPTKIDTPNTRSLNFDGNGKQRRELEMGSSKALDSYSSESSIPAMHLLSLMDPRLRSNIPTEQSRSSKAAIRPFSPAHQTKECSGGSQPGDCNKTAYSPNQWPFEFHSKRVTTETSRAIMPPVKSSSLSFQSEKSPVFTFQSSWNHHQEKNSKSKDANIAPNHSNSHHHQQSMFTSSSTDPGKFRLLGASDSMKLPLRVHVTDNATKHKTKKGQNNYAVSALPPVNISGPLICRVNRNPADFTIPDAPGNIYMIKGAELKVRKQTTFKRKPSLCKQDGPMQNKKSVAVAPAAENA